MPNVSQFRLPVFVFVIYELQINWKFKFGRIKTVKSLRSELKVYGMGMSFIIVIGLKFSQ